VDQLPASICEAVRAGRNGRLTTATSHTARRRRNTSARHDEPSCPDPKRATSRISPVSHRGRKIVARCAAGDPLCQRVAQGLVRYERFWALLATVGGEAVWGSSSRVLAITRSPEIAAAVRCCMAEKGISIAGTASLQRALPPALNMATAPLYAPVPMTPALRLRSREIDWPSVRTP